MVLRKVEQPLGGLDGAFEGGVDRWRISSKRRTSPQREDTFPVDDVSPNGGYFPVKKITYLPGGPSTTNISPLLTRPSTDCRMSTFLGFAIPNTFFTSPTTSSTTFPYQKSAYLRPLPSRHTNSPHPSDNPYHSQTHTRSAPGTQSPRCAPATSPGPAPAGSAGSSRTRAG